MGLGIKIVCISDTHGYHHDVDVPDGDMLIHSGDLTMMGELGVLLDFNDWIGSLPHKYKIVIAGNHDKSLGESATLGYKMLTNCIYLQNSGVDIEGFKIWGSPMTPAFGGMRSGLTFYTNGKKEAKGVWRGIPKKTDILITHGPPFGVLDKVARDYGFGLETETCGDGMLASKVIQIKPKLHVFGHIHEQGGKEFHADYGTHFVNASVVNEVYNVINKPITVNLV